MGAGDGFTQIGNSLFTLSEKQAKDKANINKDYLAAQRLKLEDNRYKAKVDNATRLEKLQTDAVDGQIAANNYKLGLEKEELYFSAADLGDEKEKGSILNLLAAKRKALGVDVSGGKAYDDYRDSVALLDSKDKDYEAAKAELVLTRDNAFDKQVPEDPSKEAAYWAYAKSLGDKLSNKGVLTSSEKLAKDRTSLFAKGGKYEGASDAFKRGFQLDMSEEGLLAAKSEAAHDKGIQVKIDKSFADQAKAKAGQAGTTSVTAKTGGNSKDFKFKTDTEISYRGDITSAKDTMDDRADDVTELTKALRSQGITLNSKDVIALVSQGAGASDASGIAKEYKKQKSKYSSSGNSTSTTVSGKTGYLGEQHYEDERAALRSKFLRVGTEGGFIESRNKFDWNADKPVVTTSKSDSVKKVGPSALTVKLGGMTNTELTKFAKTATGDKLAAAQAAIEARGGFIEQKPDVNLSLQESITAAANSDDPKEFSKTKAEVLTGFNAALSNSTEDAQTYVDDLGTEDKTVIENLLNNKYEGESNISSLNKLKMGARNAEASQKFTDVSNWLAKFTGYRNELTKDTPYDAEDTKAIQTYEDRKAYMEKFNDVSFDNTKTNKDSTTEWLRGLLGD